MAEIGFPSWGQDWSSTRDSTINWQHQLDQLQSARGQSELRLPQPKCSQSKSRNQREDGLDDDAWRWAAKHECERRAKAVESNHRVDDCPRRVIPTKNMQPAKQLKRRLQQPPNWPWKVMKRKIGMMDHCLHLEVCCQVQDLCSCPRRMNGS